ncbi:MAG TPA: hypothetical protein VEC19_15965 [Usitatibacter sp.]|nr:hypothetical protein [Usitatibacter sp.]
MPQPAPRLPRRIDALDTLPLAAPARPQQRRRLVPRKQNGFTGAALTFAGTLAAMVLTAAATALF